jgi:hypothetical protein
MNKPPMLEQKVAAALSAADLKSSDLADLITETESAIATADKTAKEERAKALDPALSPDPKAAREAMQDAEFSRDRLKTVLPRLQKRHNELQEMEYYAAWRADFERVEAKRDALAAEYAETYPQVVERLVDLLHRVEACDCEASHINRMAPSGARAHLRGVELTARGIERLLQPDVVIAKELRLPTFKRGANEPLLAWPPPQPSLAAQMAGMRVPGGPGPDWHAAMEERDRRRREESERLSAYYEERERELAKRREADLREAREARWRQR